MPTVTRRIDGVKRRDATVEARFAVAFLERSGLRLDHWFTDAERVGRHLAFAHTGFFTNEPSETLAAHLIQKADELIPANKLGKVYFLAGGSEANETAMKLARQYFYEKGETERKYFITRNQSYHGNTLGALAAGGNPGRRDDAHGVTARHEGLREPPEERASHIAGPPWVRVAHEDDTRR